MQDASVIKLRGLKKKFRSLSVLNGLDVTVEPGQVYGFLGRNGAGKSITLRILAGILEKGGGSVELFGEPMLNRNTNLRQRIGYVAQEQNFYGWMTLKGLGTFVRVFYPNWDDALYHKLLDNLELPNKRKVQTFSGGMMAKQTLALALAHRPPLLI
jgi:ABC-2 type transport system ATP-binding protein